MPQDTDYSAEVILDRARRLVGSIRREDEEGVVAAHRNMIQDGTDDDATFRTILEVLLAAPGPSAPSVSSQHAVASPDGSPNLTSEEMIKVEQFGKLDITSAERGQLVHMMKMAGLRSHEWEVLFEAVVIPEDEEFRIKCERMVQACKYQGFDPSVIARQVLLRWHQAERAALQELTVVTKTATGDVEWKFSNHEKVVDDMFFLIFIFLNRGAVVQKILKKSQKDSVRVIRMLCEKYGIKADDEGGRRKRSEPLDPETITLPRLSAVFSQLTCVMYHRGYGRSLFDVRLVGENLPLVIFSPMFPSVVARTARTEAGKQNIHPQLILVAIYTDNVLHQRSKPTPLDQIWTYYLASYNSSVLTHFLREQLCVQMGVIVDGKFVESLTSIRHVCLDKIRELRPHERIDDFIREMNVLF